MQVLIDHCTPSAHIGPLIGIPCHPTTLVVVQQRNGEIDKAPAHQFNWRWRLDHKKQPWEGDIVAWTGNL
jgi:hypothetical protein